MLLFWNITMAAEIYCVNLFWENMHWQISENKMYILLLDTMYLF